MVMYYLDCSFDDKDEVKALGANWDPAAKKWFVPPERFESITVFNRWQPRHRIFLNCTFEEKDQVKASGGKWDSEVKHWYITPTQLANQTFSQWLPKPSPSSSEPKEKKQQQQSASRRGNAEDASALKISDRMTVNQLQNECKHRGIKGSSGKAKDWLLEHLGEGTKWLSADASTAPDVERIVPSGQSKRPNSSLPESSSPTKQMKKSSEIARTGTPGKTTTGSKASKTQSKAGKSLDWTKAPRVASTLTVAQLLVEQLRRHPESKGLSSKSKTWFLAQLGEGSVWMTSPDLASHDFSSVPRVSAKLTLSQLVDELKSRNPSIAGLSSKKKDELLELAASGSIWTTASTNTSGPSNQAPKTTKNLAAQKLSFEPKPMKSTTVVKQQSLASAKAKKQQQQPILTNIPRQVTNHPLVATMTARKSGVAVAKQPTMLARKSAVGAQFQPNVIHSNCDPEHVPSYLRSPQANKMVEPTAQLRATASIRGPDTITSDSASHRQYNKSPFTSRDMHELMRHKEEEQERIDLQQHGRKYSSFPSTQIPERPYSSCTKEKFD
jgi:Domain of unknown function (DUF5710)